jgi:hypothetical protein
VSLQTALQQTIPLTPESFDRFSNLIDPDWIDQALQTTGTASIRRRRLPAERVVWLVIGLALFRNEPIWHIVRQLGLSLFTRCRVWLLCLRRIELCACTDGRDPEHSLTIFDRAYYAAAFLLDWQQAGQQRHWLMRAKTALR